MAERKKFNFLGNEMNTRESTGEAPVKAGNRVQELVDSIENATTNTAFNFKYIPREKLRFHEDNEYPIESVEKLAASILDVGLMHNLDVSYAEEEDIYVIDAGEQRTRALDMLIEKYRDYTDTESEEYQHYLYHVKPFEKGYPCKVSTGTSRLQSGETYSDAVRRELDEIEARMRIRISNEIGREYDPVRTKKAMDEMIMLENRRNELLGTGKPMNNREIGERLNISDRQVQKYKAIDRLIPELQTLFQEHGITLTDGANYAKLNEGEQQQILDLIKAGGNKQEVTALYGKLNRLQEEMQAKEREINKLERDRAEALEHAEAARREAAELDSRIREELTKEAEKKEEADGKLIEELQKQLESANHNIDEYARQNRELEKEKAKKEAELEEKLAAKLEETRLTPAMMRAALQVESILGLIESNIRQFKKVLCEYQDMYDSSSGEVSPEEYMEQLQKVLML